MNQRRQITIILILGLLSLLVATGYKRCSKEPTASDPDVVIQVYSQTQQRRTPASPLIASQSGVSDQYLAWIDESMENLSQDITAAGYLDHNIAPANVIIYVLHTCTPSPESQTPSFLVRADNYDGTEFDQYNPKGAGVKDGIGRVLAAEYVILDAGAPANEWIICTSEDADYVKNAARYGYEHKFLYDWDRARYDATATHSNGNYHPLIPLRSTTPNLRSTPFVPDNRFVVGGSASNRVIQN